MFCPFSDFLNGERVNLRWRRSAWGPTIIFSEKESPYLNNLSLDLRNMPYKHWIVFSLASLGLVHSSKKKNARPYLVRMWGYRWRGGELRWCGSNHDNEWGPDLAEGKISRAKQLFTTQLFFTFSAIFYIFCNLDLVKNSVPLYWIWNKTWHWYIVKA